MESPLQKSAGRIEIIAAFHGQLPSECPATEPGDRLGR